MKSHILSSSSHKPFANLEVGESLQKLTFGGTKLIKLDLFGQREYQKS